MADENDFPWMKNASECTFNEHATCVSLLRNNYKKIEGSCLPPCRHTSIHQSTMHVSISPCVYWFNRRIFSIVK